MLVAAAEGEGEEEEADGVFRGEGRGLEGAEEGGGEVVGVGGGGFVLHEELAEHLCVCVCTYVNMYICM